MKRFIFGLVAVLACTVQAISLNWTSSSDNTWAKNLDTSTGVLVYAGAATAKATAAEIAAFAKNEKALDGYTVISNEDGRFSLPLDPAAGLQGQLDITNVTQYATDGKFYLVLFTNDGKHAVGTIDGALKTADGKSYWYEPGPVESGFTYPEYDVTFDGTAVVPEPTALALLALGIAGLALRRRA